MKGIKLMVMVLSIIGAIHVDASASDGKVHLPVEKILTIDIQPVTLNSTSTKSNPSQLYAKRRKLSTTLRKPIVKKFKSKNHNLC